MAQSLRGDLHSRNGAMQRKPAMLLADGLKPERAAA
jgi:hypothetical protein